MVTKKPVRKTSTKNVTSKKITAKKRPAAKVSTAKEPAVKSKSYKKTPARPIVQKKIEISKPFGISIIACGVLALILLFVYALPVFTGTNNGEEPVLGAKSITSNPGKIRFAKFYGAQISRQGQRIEFESSHTQDYYWITCVSKDTGKRTIDGKLANTYDRKTGLRHSTKGYSIYNCWIWGMKGKYDTNHEHVW